MSEKIWLGAHTSAAGGVHNALLQGRDIGATTIQLFTSNQRQWSSREIALEEIAIWEKALHETGIGKVMSHDSYLINLGSSDPEILQKSKKAFREEIERCRALKIPFLNFHPGSAVGESEEKCLDTIVSSLLEMEDLAGKTHFLLEMTAGQGSSVGYNFRQIHYILEKVSGKIPTGVTIDTCHIFAAGYDIRTAEGWKKTLDEFDKTIGLKYLQAFHLNDSVKDIGSRVDRHSPIGQGKIGLESFRFLMTSELTRSLPKYLETPDGPKLWKNEIALLKSLAEQK
jgi:deoxyribonuclease IV